MRQLLLIFLFLAGAIPHLKAQSWLIQGNIENAEEGKVLLASFYGDRFRVVGVLSQPECQPPLGLDKDKHAIEAS